jgi:hypothetical protein
VGDSVLLVVDLDYSENGGGSWTPISMGEVNDGAYSWDISGLSDGSDYLVRVTVTDTSGLFDSDSSDAVFTIDNPDPPAAISDLMVVLADSVIQLSWTAVTVDTTGEPIVVDHYNVYRDDNPGFSPSSSDSIGNTADTFYIDFTAAVNDTSINHYYVVKAVDSGGRKSADSNRVGEFDRGLINAPPK